MTQISRKPRRSRANPQVFPKPTNVSVFPGSDYMQFGYSSGAVVSAPASDDMQFELKARSNAPVSHATSRLWHYFVKLDGKPDDALLLFAMKWGPLWEGDRGETLSIWRETIGRCASIIRVGRAMLNRGTPDQRDLKRIRVGIVSTEMASLDVANALNKLYNDAGKHLLLSPRNVAPHRCEAEAFAVEHRCSGLLALILEQIAQMLARETSHGMVSCAGCGEETQRQRSDALNSYCHKCRSNKIPQRNASRAYRQRSK